MKHMTTLTELPMWLSITMAMLSGRLQNTWQVSRLSMPACGALNRSGLCVCVCVSYGVCCSLDYFSVLRLHWYTKVPQSLFCTHRHKKIKSFFSGSRCYITFPLYICRATKEERGTKRGRRANSAPIFSQVSRWEWWIAYDISVHQSIGQMPY